MAEQSDGEGNFVANQAYHPLPLSTARKTGERHSRFLVTSGSGPRAPTHPILVTNRCGELWENTTASSCQVKWSCAEVLVPPRNPTSEAAIATLFHPACSVAVFRVAAGARSGVTQNVFLQVWT